MTLEDFYETFERTRLRWFLDQNGRLRARTSGGRLVSPLTAVHLQETSFYLRPTHPFVAETAARHLGMEPALARRIACACESSYRGLSALREPAIADIRRSLILLAKISSRVVSPQPRGIHGRR